MRKLSKGKWLAVVLALALVMSLVPMMAGADNNNNNNGDPVAENFGFVPNHGEASVSKVELVSGTAVARYWTAPRAGDMVDAFGEPQDEAFGIDPFAWRTNRIAVDSSGNAWAINTGVNGSNLQGSVARIQFNTSGIDADKTSQGHDDILDFGQDEAVKVFAVGEPGDIPRAINFDDDGYAWIGFHMQNQKYGYYQKYVYTGDDLEPVGDPVGGWDGVDENEPDYDIAPYNAAIDKNGVLWFASYGSSVLNRSTGDTFAADNGVYSFDTTATDPGATLQKYSGIARGYGILVDNGDIEDPDDPVIVYATDQEVSGEFYKLDTTDGNTVFSKIDHSGVNGGRGLTFDNEGNVWIASFNAGRVALYMPETGFVASWRGFGNPGPTGRQDGIVNPVGIGRDAAGKLWVVMRNDDSPAGYLRGFEPAGLIQEALDGLPGDPPDVTDIEVGWLPYAYADFVADIPETGCLSVEKVWEGYDNVIGFDEDTMIPDSIDILIKGPSFETEYPEGKLFILESDSDPAWYLEVCDLEPGDYYVYEDAENEDWYDKWDISVSPYPVTIEAGGEPADAKATITNTYQPGCLEINKDWIVDEEIYFDVAYPEAITVLIEGPSFECEEEYPASGKVVTLEPEDWSWESCDVLIPGRYFITELDFEGSEFWTSVYIVDGSAVAGWVDVEPGEKAEVTIRNYYLFKDDTIWAYSAYAYDELELTGDEEEGVVYHNNKVAGNPSNAWGWSNKISVTDAVYGESDQEFLFYLFAGAGQNDTERGEMVGTLTVEVEPEVCGETGDELDTFCATVTYDVNAPYVLSEYHLWVGDTPLPEVQRGRGTVSTAAPGQFPYGDGDTICGLDLEEGFFVAAHGVIRMPYEPAPEECTWTGVWDTDMQGEVTFTQANSTVTGTSAGLLAPKWYEGTVNGKTLSGEWGWGSLTSGTFSITMSDDCQSFSGEIIEMGTGYDWNGTRQ